MDRNSQKLVPVATRVRTPTRDFWPMRTTGGIGQGTRVHASSDPRERAGTRKLTPNPDSGELVSRSTETGKKQRYHGPKQPKTSARGNPGPDPDT